MREIFITDIHNQFTKTQNLLDSIDYNPTKDLLILGGDYFDRGPEAMLVAKWLEEIYQHKNVVLLRGNHDLALIELLEGSWVSSISSYIGIEHMMKNNGLDITIEGLMGTPRRNNYKQYMDSINKQYPHLLSALKSTKWYYETEDAIFTHSTLPDDYKNADDEEWVHHVWANTYKWAREVGESLPKKTYVGHYALVNVPSWDGIHPVEVGNVVMCDGALGWSYDGIVIVI